VRPVDGAPDTGPITPWRLAAILLLLSFGSAQTVPATAADTDRERAAASARLEGVLREIELLGRQLESARTEQRDEQSRLREVDLQIQQASRELRALDEQRQERERSLQSLERSRQEYLANLGERMAQLAEQLRSAYRSGRQSRVKLVLNQDEPARLGRLLAYYDYINRAQVARIGQLRESLSRLDAIQRAIDAELERIAELVEEQQVALERLGDQRTERENLLAELARRIGGDEARLQELEQNRLDLEALLERLADVLADIPADLGSHLGVARQKGALPMPVRGPVKHAFGQRRGGGLNWQGWLIGAPAGSEVQAVAYGRVAFADWLRGYGLLMIIDHGQGFMTLYGHNESLLQEAGAWVEPGDTISVVGNNPGSDQGLYFELRRDGKAIDPAGWLAR